MTLSKGLRMLIPTVEHNNLKKESSKIVQGLAAGNYQGRSYFYNREVDLKIKEKNGCISLKLSEYDPLVSNKMIIPISIYNEIGDSILNRHERFLISTDPLSEKGSRLFMHIKTGMLHTLSIRTQTEEVIGFNFRKIETINKAKEIAQSIFCFITFFPTVLGKELLSAFTREGPSPGNMIKDVIFPVFDPVIGFSYEINNEFFYKIHINDNIITVYYKDNLWDKKAAYDKILYKDLIEHKKESSIALTMNNIMPYHSEHGELHHPFDLYVNHYHVQIEGLLVITLDVFEFFMNGLVSANLLDKAISDTMINDFNKSFFISRYTETK